MYNCKEKGKEKKVTGKERKETRKQGELEKEREYIWFLVFYFFLL